MRRFRYLLDEKGQAIILFALLLPVLFGFVGLAVDIGWITYNKNKLQSASDLAVLAGGQDIPESYDKNDTIRGLNADGTGTPFNCQSHTPDPSVKSDKVTALKYFCENYPSSAVEQIYFGKSTKIPGQEFYGILATVSDKIPLFFMPLLGINEITISAESYVVVEKPKQPVEVIPMAFALSDMVAIMNGDDQPSSLTSGCRKPDKLKKEVLVWTEDSTSMKGNFGIIDITGNVSGSNLALLIEKGIPYLPDYNVPPPPVGTKVQTKTGSLTSHIAEGFQKRIDSKRLDVWLPIVDMANATGTSVKLDVLGYTLIRLLPDTPPTLDSISPSGGDKRVCIYGMFEKQVNDTAALYDIKATYFGVKRVLLVDRVDYESKY